MSADNHDHESAYGRELELAIDSAHRAGEVLKAGFGSRLVERRNGPHDVVTTLDRAAEAMIMKAISSEFPGDRRLGEETGLAVPRGRAGQPRRTWLVDPLDGTINFVSGIPFWCVSLALAIDSTVVLGVIHDPLGAETYISIAGGGARRLSTGESLRPRRLRRIADAVIAADSGAVGDAAADARVAALRSQVRSIRVLGSTALSLTLLAAGRLDAVLQVRGLNAFDIAAGGLIAIESGARITDADGGPWISIDRPDRGAGIAAARAGLHRRLLSGAPDPS